MLIGRLFQAHEVVGEKSQGDISAKETKGAVRSESEEVGGQVGVDEGRVLVNFEGELCFCAVMKGKAVQVLRKEEVVVRLMGEKNDLCSSTLDG